MADARDLVAETLAGTRWIGKRAREASMLASLAVMLCDAENVEAARRAGTEALALSDEVSEPRISAVARNALARATAAAGDHDEAVRLCDGALVIADRVGLPFIGCEALLGLALIHLTQGDHERSGRFGERALTLARAMRFLVLEGRALTVLAVVHYRLEQAPQALATACRALQVHLATGYAMGLAETNLLLAPRFTGLDAQEPTSPSSIGTRRKRSIAASACPLRSTRAPPPRWLHLTGDGPVPGLPFDDLWEVTSLSVDARAAEREPEYDALPSIRGEGRGCVG